MQDGPSSLALLPNYSYRNLICQRKIAPFVKITVPKFFLLSQPSLPPITHIRISPRNASSRRFR